MVDLTPNIETKAETLINRFISIKLKSGIEISGFHCTYDKTTQPKSIWLAINGFRTNIRLTMIQAIDPL